VAQRHNTRQERRRLAGEKQRLEQFMEQQDLSLVDPNSPALGKAKLGEKVEVVVNAEAAQALLSQQKLDLGDIPQQPSLADLRRLKREKRITKEQFESVTIKRRRGRQLIPTWPKDE